MDWLADLCCVDSHDEDVILVTVAHVEGSTPRDTGTKMLVFRHALSGTIGGGHLEFCAISRARKMLGQEKWPQNKVEAASILENFALGPTLGQCCGGVVTLAFEEIGHQTRSLFSVLYARWQLGLASRRVIPLGAQGSSSLYDREGNCIHGELLGCISGDGVGEFEKTGLFKINGQRWLVDPCIPYRSHLMLFGAGHVGSAIVRILAELPCNVTWVDERAEQFPAVIPNNVMIEVSDAPEMFVDRAPLGASFLVLTHSHPLDQKLAEKIVLRDDVQWFGLIGSRTKRVRFERRLRAMGVADSRIDRMVCPIGINGIDGKEPAVIAVAVVAQLLQVWQCQVAQQAEKTTNRMAES